MGTDVTPPGSSSAAIPCVTLVWRESLSNPVIAEQVIARTRAWREEGIDASVVVVGDPAGNEGPVQEDWVDSLPDCSSLSLVRRARSAMRGPRGVLICRGPVTSAAAVLARGMGRRDWSVVYDCRAWYSAELGDRGRASATAPLKDRIDRFAFRRADAVVVVSPSLHGIAVAKGARAESTHLIPPYTPARPTPGVSPAPNADVIYVGRSAEGYQTEAIVLPVLEAIAKANPDLAIGWLDDSASADPEWLMDNLWRRRVPPDEVSAHLAAARVGLLIREPTGTNLAAMPTKVGQYLASGCRIVTSAYPPSVAFLCLAGNAGSVIGADDPDSWAQAVRREAAREVGGDFVGAGAQVTELWVKLIEDLSAS